MRPRFSPIAACGAALLMLCGCATTTTATGTAAAGTGVPRPAPSKVFDPSTDRIDVPRDAIIFADPDSRRQFDQIGAVTTAQTAG